MAHIDAPPFIRALLHPDAYGHPAGTIQLTETHISWVLLTGDYVYKIKKPVNFGFLDFSSLEKRRHACHEELRLNQRLAPALYLDVVRVTRAGGRTVINGEGDTIDYAVRMKQFDTRFELDRMAERGELQPGHMDKLAQQLAQFHDRIPGAKAGQPWGEPDNVLQPARDNLTVLQQTLTDADARSLLARLEQWTEQQFLALQHRFADRKRHGRIRECHGDLHLANIVLIGEQLTIFDCIEFSEALRWNDVMSELAFAVMDLEDRGHSELGQQLLNRYLEWSGDYEGLALLPWYLVYRALVRAKVAALRMQQEANESDSGHDRALSMEYLALALKETVAHPQALIITHGLSGSGKTWLSEQLMRIAPLVRLRSDIERKRLFGMSPLESSGPDREGSLYSADANRQTYERLAQLADTVLRGGQAVIVDAAFLRHAERQQFQELAHALGVPFRILALHTNPARCLERVRQRRVAGNDASEADADVLARQRQWLEPLTPDEAALSLAVDGDRFGPPDLPALLERLPL